MSDSNVCSFCSRPSHLRETMSCKTLCVSSCYHIIWAINNFSLIEKEKREPIFSPTFLTGSNGTKWNLKLYPYGTSSRSDKYVGLFLYNPNDSEKNVNFTLSVLNKKRNKCSIEKVEKNKIGKESDWGFSSFIAREELFKTQSDLLPNDTLTISCELQVIDDLEESCSYKKIGMEEVCQDLKQLLTSCDLSDVTISIGSNKYPAHRTILAARSPVFAAIFKHDFLENRTNVIEVTDIEPKVMEQVLHYIYTGSCPEIKEMAADIIVAAEKYDLAGLKKLCEETLSELLNPENTAATLIAADLCNSKQLRDETLDYICKHIKEVHHTSGWNEMTESHPHLELEVLRAFAYRNTTIL